MNRPGDRGFTLVELLVVMVVIGILAGIAVPVIIDQRRKAQDAVTRSDTRRLGHRVLEHWLDRRSAPTVAVVAGRFVVDGDDAGPVSAGVSVAGPDPTVVDTAGWTASAWCLALTNPRGSLPAVRFSAQQGLEAGMCDSVTAP